LDTVDILQNTSDKLLKVCNIKAGQIVRIRKALSGLEALTTSEPVEHYSSDGDVVIRVVRDLSEMQEISFNAEILPELPPEMVSNDESPMPPPRENVKNLERKQKQQDRQII
jgi:hypothetical protein